MNSPMTATMTPSNRRPHSLPGQRATRRRVRGGAVLAITLILLTVAAFVSFSMASAVSRSLKLNRNNQESVDSLAAAEAAATAVLAWWLFGETLTITSLLGLACTAVGVALVVRHVPALPRGPGSAAPRA